MIIRHALFLILNLLLLACSTVTEEKTIDDSRAMKGELLIQTGFLLNPMLAGAAMALSSVSVVSNSLRLKWKK